MQISLILLRRFQLFFGETSAAAPIVEDEEVGLSDDNVGVIGSTNEIGDEVIFNMLSASSRKSYNYVNKIIL